MMASQVHLVSIGRQEDEFPQLGASEYLSRHGIASELHLIDPGIRDAEDVLHQFALDKGAGCLLIGAYGHSRLRETLLGGVTRYLTLQSRVPLMLAR
jgi:nucleotide-binding universal stress UspA family protein